MFCAGYIPDCRSLLGILVRRGSQVATLAHKTYKRSREMDFLNHHIKQRKHDCQISRLNIWQRYEYLLAEMLLICR